MRKLIVLLFFILFGVFSSYSISEEVDNELSQINLNDVIGLTEEEDTLTEFLYKMTLPQSVLKSSTNNCGVREKYQIPQFFQFIPALKAKLFKVGDQIEFGNYCFQKNIVKLLTINQDSIELNLFSDEPTSKLCSDIYIFHTSYIKHIKTTFMKGNHTITIKALKPIHLQEIALGGLRLFSFCESIPKTVSSAYKTIKLLLSDYPEDPKQMPSLGGKTRQTPEEQEKEHIDFLRLYAGIEIERRYGWEDKVIDVKDHIQTGDFLGLSQVINGESCLIQYMTGGRISHAAIAVRLDDELYVAENANKGIVIVPYDDYIKEQIRTYHSLAWFPLSDEARKMFNEEKAVEYLKERVGFPYGLRNFVYSQIDAKNNNLPEYIAIETIQLISSLLESIAPDAIDIVFLSAMNMRMGTNKLSTSQLGEEIAKRNTTWEDVMIIPERDEWRYSNGENLVCSSYVAGAYKAGGLFGDLDIQAHEFTPKDIYQLNIFKKNVKEKRPQKCIEADPELDYCQIMGKYRIKVNEYSTIMPYAHMNEKCECMPPSYLRPIGC